MNFFARCFFLLLFTLNTTQVHAMGLLDFFTIHVFSDVTGVVTLNGEPVEGAEVVRSADHTNDKVYMDSAITDKNGKFSFNNISTFSLRPIMLPTVIFQKIVIKHNGMEYLAWETTKRNNHNNGELNDAGTKEPIKLNLSCELTDDEDKYEVIKFDIRKRRVTGLCSWH